MAEQTRPTEAEARLASADHPDLTAAPAVSTTTPGVHIRGLKKWYGDTRALDGLDLDAYPGEILGIAGPNGAGKSTLIKVLANETSPTAGEITINGQPWDPQRPDHRVAVVHQEPQLFPNLTVGENLMVGRERSRFDRPALSPQDLALLDELSIREFVNRPLEACTLAVQQRTEIARALAQDSQIFLFDEPNSALTNEESADLFRRMHLLAGAGKVVMLVSHRLSELVAHTKRVMIVLDGKRAGIVEESHLTQDAIARELVVGQTGREDDAVILRAAADAPASLRLEGWSHQKKGFEDIHLHVRDGEIAAIVGVEGSGARELVRSIAGFEQATGGIEIDGVKGVSAIGGRTGFVTADRNASLFSNMSVGENLVSRLGAPHIADGTGVLRPGRMSTTARELVDRFRVKTKSPQHPIRSLSGGNQQKVAIAAAVITRPKVLVLEEPTRGVDISSKREIYRLLRDYAHQGHAVILYCTEVPEVFEAADYVHVVSDGRISDPLMVLNYPDVESLATDVTKLERHHAGAEPLAAAGTAGASPA